MKEIVWGKKIIIGCIVVTTILSGCNTKKEMEEKELVSVDLYEKQEKSIEFDNYAIYLSVITEENPSDKSPYLVWPTSIKLQFPQFYYSRESKEFNEKIEVQINEKLFLGSVRGNTGNLTARNNTDLKEHNADYIIAMANENMFSVKFESHIYTVWRADEFCNGMTIDAHTGESLSVSEFVTIDENLVKKVKNEEAECITPGYDKEYILELLEVFVEDYRNGRVDEYSCFYLDEEYVYLIVPTQGGNLHYYTIRMERRMLGK